MKIVFIGCVESSARFFKAINRETKAEIVGVVTKAHSNYNADHQSLAPLAEEHNIDWLDFIDNEQIEEWIKNKEPDLIYCFGWSHILPESIFSIPRYGAVGYHPALLPENRGRHPIIWALALGLKQTGSTFFYLTEEADAGDIISQEIVDIENEEDAGSLYEKLMKIGERQVVGLTKKFMNQTIQPVKQDTTKANTWRKRSKSDGLIDWRMSTKSIVSLIRALANPYVGAHAVYQGEDCIIWKAEEISESTILVDNIEPGKVVESDGKIFVVKTGDSLVKIIEHDWKVIPKRGEYL